MNFALRGRAGGGAVLGARRGKYAFLLENLGSFCRVTRAGPFPAAKIAAGWGREYAEMPGRGRVDMRLSRNNRGKGLLRSFPHTMQFGTGGGGWPGGVMAKLFICKGKKSGNSC